jgi:peptidyl-prolyl cis-trans isomerase SurA
LCNFSYQIKNTELLKNLFLATFLLLTLTLIAQDKKGKVVDRIVAVVGEKIVLQSDLEEQFRQIIASGVAIDNETRCDVVEDLIFQKLLLMQAEKDSVTVPEGQVQSELERRIKFFVSQIGSEKKLEAFYEKSISEIKADFHDIVKDQLLMQTMQSKITENIKVTPADVRRFYESIPKDSLPFINAEYEIAQIVKNPPVSEEEINRVRQRLREFRERILAGEDFGTLAYLYSEDPGSARENGELGFMARGTLVPEFSAVAFNLEKGEISGIVQTEFGYHLIQMVERRGQEVNVRHILLKPKVKSTDMLIAKNFLDSIKTLISTVDTLTFEKAATLFSEDKETKNNSGYINNPITGFNKFEMNDLSQVEPGLFFMIGNMKKGEISAPEIFTKRDGSKAYRLIYISNIIEPHRANMDQDYQKIQAVAMQEKQEKELSEWVNKKMGNYYIKIDDDFKTCPFRHNWTVKN